MRKTRLTRGAAPRGRRRHQSKEAWPGRNVCVYEQPMARAQRDVPEGKTKENEERKVETEKSETATAARWKMVRKGKSPATGRLGSQRSLWRANGAPDEQNEGRARISHLLIDGRKPKDQRKTYTRTGETRTEGRTGITSNFFRCMLPSLFSLPAKRRGGAPNTKHNVAKRV